MIKFQVHVTDNLNTSFKKECSLFTPVPLTRLSVQERYNIKHVQSVQDICFEQKYLKK